MNCRRLHWFVLLVALAAVRPLRALDWAKTEASVTPERGAEVVRFRFDFKNPAKQTVHILEVRTSCGCTEATPSSSVIAPGESGGVDVLFTIGQRTGLQEKEITLFTDDAKEPVRLRLKIKLPEAEAATAK